MLKYMMISVYLATRLAAPAYSSPRLHRRAEYSTSEVSDPSFYCYRFARALLIRGTGHAAVLFGWFVSETTRADDDERCWCRL